MITLVVGLFAVVLFLHLYFYIVFLLHKTIFCLLLLSFLSFSSSCFVARHPHTCFVLFYLILCLCSNFAHLTNNHLSHIMFCFYSSAMFTFFFLFCNYYRSSLVLSQSIALAHQYIFFVTFILLFYSLTYVFFLVFIFLCFFLVVFFFNLALRTQIKSLFLLIFSFFLLLFLSLSAIFFLILQTFSFSRSSN